jgi:hypothetical protein
VKSEVGGPSVFLTFVAANLFAEGHKSLIINTLSNIYQVNLHQKKVFPSADKSADTMSKLQNPQLNIIVRQIQISQILLDF